MRGSGTHRSSRRRSGPSCRGRTKHFTSAVIDISCAVPSSPDQIIRSFAALADPTRLAILQRLRSGERRVGDLCKETKLAQSLISFHLKTLREAGLLSSRREGRTIWYALDPGGIARLKRVVASLGVGGAENTEAAREADLDLCRRYINGR